MRRLLSLAFTLLLLVSAPAALSSPDTEAQVRAAVTAFNDAYGRNDLDTYFAFYASDVTLIFDSGRVVLEDYRKDWYQLIADGGGVESNVVSDIQIRLGPSGDTAVASYRGEVRTRYADGKIVVEHTWETDVWFRSDAGWRIAHLQYSAGPAD